MRTLQVNTLTRRVGSNQYLDGFILGEGLLRPGSFLPAQSTMNVNHSLCPAKHGTDTLRQIVEGIAVFGKDDQLAAMSFGIKHLCIVLKQAGKSFPFSICSATAD